ncbi:hypothetical protein C8Q80DRAFT_1145714 [Daedaleopsis nitida]|nr:hypothetical protein C8Q80DRAFT_1145714 [Daedaleopsis nitida]
MISRRLHTDNATLFIDITDNNAVVLRGNSWTKRSDDSAGILMGYSQIGDSATVVFNGTYVQAYGEHANEPHSYSYAVDNSAPTVRTFPASGYFSNVELFHAWIRDNTTDDTTHTLVITNLEGSLWLGFFAITDRDYPLPKPFSSSSSSSSSSYTTVDLGAAASTSAPASSQHASSALNQHPGPSAEAPSNSPSPHKSNSRAIAIACVLAVLVGLMVLMLGVRLLFRRKISRDVPIAPPLIVGADPETRKKVARMSSASASKDHRLSCATTASSVSTLPPYGYTWEPQLEQGSDLEDNRPPSYTRSDSDSVAVALPERYIPCLATDVR